MAIFVYFTPSFQNPNKTFPWYFYALAVLFYGIHQVFLYNMFVSQMAFFAKVSDPKIGGTYMTLLNTLANLGSSWMSTTVLYAGDYLQWKKCSIHDGQCVTKADEQKCEALGGACRAYIDAYYIEVTICTILGVLWLIWKYRTLLRLQNLPMSAWQVHGTRRRSESDDDNLSSVMMTA